MKSVVLPSDKDNRRMAAAELGHNVVVSAGAGTGKTRLLIDRLTLLILGEKISVEKIVALTFTKKAAEELRDRLEKRLRELIANPRCFDVLNEEYPGGEDERVALASRALDDIPKAQIGTIHSFAGHLLRLYPVQAQVDPAFREDDGTGFATLFETEWQGWLAGELASGGPRAKAWAGWLGAVDIADLKETARALAALDRTGDVPGPAAPIAPLVDETIRSLDELVERLGIPPKTRTFGPRIDSVRRILMAARAGKKISPVDVKEVEALKKAKLPGEWGEDEIALAEMPVILRRASDMANIDEALVAGLCEAVRPFAERMRSELGRRGVLSFDDLLVKARNLVRDHRKVRAALKRQFAAFLVDEFQDTDPLQGEILFYLAEDAGTEAASWRDARLGPGRLFVVGDPKQSIYRFRGADIAAFEEFWNRLVQQGALRATLSNNFRSRRHIIDAVNGIFPPNMRKEAFLQPAYEPLATGREGDEPDGCEIVTISVPDGEGALTDDTRAFEASTVADWIAEHAGHDLGGAPLAFSGVAILLRGTSAFAPYLEALRERGIPFLAEGEKTYYHRPEVLEFTNLLAAIADPNDRLSLAGLLRSPLGGLTDLQLAELTAAGGLDYRRHPPFHKEQVGPLYETLRQLSADAHARPVPDVIKAVFDGTWLLEVAAGRRHGEQAVANLRKVCLLAEKWLESEPMTLTAFVRRLREYREDKKDEGENPLADVQFDAVRVMTIHKAKGLEFPVVFLPNLSAVSGKSSVEPAVALTDWRSGRTGVRIPRLGIVNAARVMIDEDIASREAAEEVRVFYVAMTRAKERLVLLVKDDAPAGAVFAGYLARAGFRPTDGAKAVEAGGASVPVRWLAWKRSGPPSGMESTTGFTREWNVAALAETMKRRDAERAACRLASPALTPTALLHAAKASFEKEKRALTDDDEAALDRTPAIMIGHICHAVLERWDFKTPAKTSAKTLRAAVLAAALRFELIPENPDRDRIVDECTAVLTTFVASAACARIAKARVEAREMPFFYPLGTGDVPRIMRGVMDVVYSEGETLVVGDYKTNNVDAATMAAVAESYRPQGEAYVRAISAAMGRKAEFELIFLRVGEAVRLRF